MASFTVIGQKVVLKVDYNVDVVLSNGDTNKWRVDSPEELLDEIRFEVRKHGNIKFITIKDPEILLKGVGDGQ